MYYIIPFHFSVVIGKMAVNRAHRKYIKEQGDEYQKLYEDRQLVLF